MYLSFVVKKQLYTEYVTGAVVNSGDLKVVAKKIQTIEFNGIFKKKVRAGRALLLSQIDGTTTPVTEIPFKDAEDYKNFDVDAYCVIGTDDNSGAGFKILSIDETNNKMTIEDGVTTVQDADAIIKGFTPVAVESGVDATSTFGWVTLNTGAAGDRDVAITEAAYKCDNGFKALDDIAYDSHFTGEVGTDSRKVTVDITKYFTVRDLGFDFDIKKQTDIVVKLNIGKESGASAVIEMPKTRILKASESGSPEVKKQPSHQCYPDTGDDESILILK